MAGAESENDDFKFVMTCLKHTVEKPKPNYDEVAKELGAKNATACYKRHWSILKKWGLAGNSGKGRKPAGETTTKTTTAQKRKANNDDSGGDDKPPAKKGKAAPKKKTKLPKVQEEEAEEAAGEGDDEVKEAKPEEDED
ncbi:hypothetical protein A1O7_03010 [Cladophialophora yegresii CBS 114405]|uniref:Myb-like DNA-binding domain-containing protein n=1 Tax=Cladophialophora yegresii CBS 114405 TaxID=1182544 RepID=W9W3D5_9EURO|nr:uncharacterized protein A1O7_03010 [Cladophialophora yegresii CBS 114405]EXJ62572.1 hypothetical protein A1O7_03010 [Cladophialophora yegresii CBS 114405]